jgi:hypothetical protein
MENCRNNISAREVEEMTDEQRVQAAATRYIEGRNELAGSQQCRHSTLTRRFISKWGALVHLDTATTSSASSSSLSSSSASMRSTQTGMNGDVQVHVVVPKDKGSRPSVEEVFYVDGIGQSWTSDGRYVI